jgi:Ca2+-transporting ATPase
MISTKPVKAQKRDWYQQQPEQTAQQVDTVLTNGLSSSEAQKRLLRDGRNELTEKASKSILTALYEQLSEPLVVILLVAAGLSAVLGKGIELVAILAIVGLNALLGIIQEYRAEKAIAALKKMSQPQVRVRRDGKDSFVDATELVVGDIVLVEAGSIIPADARIVEAHNLRVQEASLTGESYAVDKTALAIEGENLPLGDRKNMLYMGTNVAYGRGEALVIATGMNTELGKIADMLQSVGDEKSPLQKRISELGRVLFVAAFVVMGIAIVVGLVTGHSFQDVLLNSVAIAVAVVPEGLPAVVTISLALGAQRMLKRRALIRKLPAVETLGSVTVIASDKTGTLTENRMTVRVIDVAGDTYDLTNMMQNKQHEPVPASVSRKLILVAAALANDGKILDDGSSLGDPTETALLTAAQTYNLNRNSLDSEYPRIAEVPFSSERKRMTTIHQNTDREHTILNGDTHKYIAFTKGASDGLIDISTHVFNDGVIEPMTNTWRTRIEASNDKLAADGLRVLGVAFKAIDSFDSANLEGIESEMVFVGLIGMIDPPRPEVVQAVKISKTAGIRPVMITGDHPMTALAIAKQIGIAEEGATVLTGRQLSEITDEQLREAVQEVSVYARVSPEHKLRIVRALKDIGHIVAMTGDGVNDAPALKQADIGVAMGITGTDVTKEASDMVITDDNFATIVFAAEEGRAIYDNVRRFIKYLLASNTGELLVLLSAQLVTGMTIPLNTLQILWMNLITDGIPALALGLENAEKDAMTRPPYAPNESILGRGLARHILLIGSALGLTGLGLGVWAFQNNILAANGMPAWNTMVFLLLTIAQMGHALGLRSHSESVFRLSFFSNKYLLGAIGITIVLQMLAVYLPFFNRVFGTQPLELWQLGLVFALSTIVFWVVEFEKLLMRRGLFK